LQINTYDQPGVEYGKLNLVESFSQKSWAPLINAYSR
jgi:glucose-6-phosphate isomerase